MFLALNVLLEIDIVMLLFITDAILDI